MLDIDSLVKYIIIVFTENVNTAEPKTTQNVVRW